MNELRAVQISIEEPELQAYLQRYPFSVGPDTALNERTRAAVASSIVFRDGAPDVQATLLDQRQTELSDVEAGRARTMLTALGIEPETQRGYFHDFAWEANMAPRAARNVLVVGCGNGIEMVFLRAVLPDATFTALDYYSGLVKGLQDAVGVQFIAGDMNENLGKLERRYDFVYSNHVMEHFYTPEKMLARIARLLVPGATLISTLPMTGKVGTPFLEQVHQVASGQKPHPVDASQLDPGHPWKTNPGDLQQTLQRAGFTRVELFQRRAFVTRSEVSCTHEELARRRNRGVRANSLLLAPARRALKLLFPRAVPETALKLYFGMERRVSCGTNRMMSDYSEEVLVRCSTPA